MGICGFIILVSLLLPILENFCNKKLTYISWISLSSSLSALPSLTWTTAVASSSQPPCFQPPLLYSISLTAARESLLNPKRGHGPFQLITLPWLPFQNRRRVFPMAHEALYNLSLPSLQPHLHLLPLTHCCLLFLTQISHGPALGLCTCLGCFSPSYPGGLLSHLLQIFALISLPWPL